MAARVGGMRARQPAVGRSGDVGPRHRSRTARLPARRVRPHAGRAHLSDRQPLLRLGLPVGARAVHGRPADLPRPRPRPRRLIEHQRADLPARQPARLRALGGRPRDGDVGLRPLPAVLQEDGDVSRGRARTTRGAATTVRSSWSAAQPPTRCSGPSSRPARRRATSSPRTSTATARRASRRSIGTSTAAAV